MARITGIVDPDSDTAGYKSCTAITLGISACVLRAAPISFCIADYKSDRDIDVARAEDHPRSID